MGIYIETDFYFFTAYIFFHSQRIILIMTHSLVTTTNTPPPQQANAWKDTQFLGHKIRAPISLALLISAVSNICIFRKTRFNGVDICTSRSE